MDIDFFIFSVKVVFNVGKFFLFYTKTGQEFLDWVYDLDFFKEYFPSYGIGLNRNCSPCEFKPNGVDVDFCPRDFKSNGVELYTPDINGSGVLYFKKEQLTVYCDIKEHLGDVSALPSKCLRPQVLDVKIPGEFPAHPANWEWLSSADDIYRFERWLHMPAELGEFLSDITTIGYCMTVYEQPYSIIYPLVYLLHIYPF